jgi:hypothetical protein
MGTSQNKKEKFSKFEKELQKIIINDFNLQEYEEILNSYEVYNRENYDDFFEKFSEKSYNIPQFIDNAEIYLINFFENLLKDNGFETGFKIWQLPYEYFHEMITKLDPIDAGKIKFHVALSSDATINLFEGVSYFFFQGEKKTHRPILIMK